MKAKKKVKKQRYSKEERDVDNIFRKKGESPQDALKRIITREHQRIVEKEKKDLTAALAKVVPIEKKEGIQVKGKGEERKYIDNSCGRETEIEYNSREIEDLLAHELWFPIEGLFKLGEELGMDDEKVFGFMEAGESLLREAKQEAQEICELIEKHVGKIEIDFRDYHSGIDKQDKLGIALTPVAQAKEA
ncbi:MAG: hypothetical protein NT096_01605 [Proteobacteria bacterium]|nr:hypothetical protein [Pseudomonadota bacterium]